MRPAILVVASLASAALLVAAFAAAQRHGAANTDHAGHLAHGADATSTDRSATPLTEPGQGAFAALSEAVAALAADPNTDWSRVDVAGLREHLVQMDSLITDTVAEARAIDGGHEFTVRGEGRALEAIRAMVPAHARVLEAGVGWETEVEPIGDGAILRVRSDDAVERERIGALGFHGAMVTGDHHREHHWTMVRGGEPHGH